MSLAKYREKRDFSKTREPPGEARERAGHSYVIQKHAASHLHYDFRLELNGVLLSWAVPKGPSLDPEVKRLAMQTEDHPIEYGGFEGTIPEGEYGGGTVMVWDHGTWEPEGDPVLGMEKGHLSFQLHGQKLSGGWHLVRTRRGEKQNGWLLFKAHDQAAKPGDRELLETDANSALTGRDLESIAASEPNVWHGKSAKSAAGSKRSAPKTQASGKLEKRARAIVGAERAAMPSAIDPELATLVVETPNGEDFVHEVKFDGYRVIARVESERIVLLTRNGEDWTERMPSLSHALRKLPAKNAILDGEFVALDAKGISDFQLLQNSFSGKSEAPLAYYAFDLLYLDGFDLRPLPLIARKEQLKRLFDQLPKSQSMLRYSDHTLGKGAEFFAAAAKLGLEGVVSKRANSTYRSGRGKDWQKSKSSARQEFVIVGFTDPAGGRSHLGALLLGVGREKKIVYSGRVGTGFDQRSLKDLHERLAPLQITQPKLENAPRGAATRGVHWVEPKLIAEVAYTGITQDGLLRHPTFKGLREDKAVTEVVLESAQGAPARAKLKKARATAARASELSNPEKVLYPELGLTKRDLAEYYEVVSQAMMPHVIDRPLTLLRCPGGRSAHCFFQKHPAETLAAGLLRVQVPSSDGPSEYAAIADARGLQALIQMSALEVHIWGSRASDAERPDRLVFDLDPDPELSFKEVIVAARATRALLQELGLKSWVKTTGGKGLHVTVPIIPRADWDEAKEFSRAVAEELTRRDPERYLATMSKARRRGKIFVDYLRNGRGATFIAPYSPRAREGAGVAMPIEWDELSSRFKPEAFTVQSAARYLSKRRSDPFESMLDTRQKLPRLPSEAKRAAATK